MLIRMICEYFISEIRSEDHHKVFHDVNLDAPLPDLSIMNNLPRRLVRQLLLLHLNCEESQSLILVQNIPRNRERTSV